MKPIRPKPWAADLALAGNTLIWGSTFVVVKQALSGISPFLFLALRFSLAALALLILFRRAWSHPRNVRYSLRGGVLAGGFLFMGYAFQTVGLRLTTPSKSAFLTGTSIVMVPFLAAIVYHTRPRMVELAGIGLATLGMALMTLHAASLAIGRGDVLTLCCALGFAAHIVTLGHYAPESSFEVLSVSQVAVAALLGISLFWWVETPSVEWRPAVWIAILVTGLLATALGFTVQAWAQQFTTSTRTALIFTLEPVFAWVTSFVVMGEILPVRAVVGACLILGGVLLVEVKPVTAQQHP